MGRLNGRKWPEIPFKDAILDRRCQHTSIVRISSKNPGKLRPLHNRSGFWYNKTI